MKMDGKKLSLKIMDSGIENGDYFFVPYLFEKEVARYDKGAKADMELVYVRDDLLTMEYVIDYDGGEMQGSVYLYKREDKTYKARLYVDGKGREEF